MNWNLLLCPPPPTRRASSCLLGKILTCGPMGSRGCVDSGWLALPGEFSPSRSSDKRGPCSFNPPFNPNLLPFATEPTGLRWCVVCAFYRSGPLRAEHRFPFVHAAPVLGAIVLEWSLDNFTSSLTLNIDLDLVTSRKLSLQRSSPSCYQSPFVQYLQSNCTSSVYTSVGGFDTWAA